MISSPSRSLIYSAAILDSVATGSLDRASSVLVDHAPEASTNPSCDLCQAFSAVEDGLCRECWNEINGQLGVGA